MGSIPGYLLEDQLGVGTYGTVFRGVQHSTGQDVAVKLLRSPGPALPPCGVHPYLLPLVDAQPGHLVTPLMQGSLAAWLRDAREFRPQLLRRWLTQVAEALDYAHQRGLIHCNLKPDNVLLDSQGNARLGDLGQAATWGGGLGTVYFMPPEQATGDLPAVSWDIYGLGATFYYLVTGRCPRATEENRQRLATAGDRRAAYPEELRRAPVTPLRQLNPAADGELAPVIERCLELDPAVRFATASEVLAALAGRRPRRGSSLVWHWYLRENPSRLARLLGGRAEVAELGAVMGFGICASLVLPQAYLLGGRPALAGAGALAAGLAVWASGRRPPTQERRELVTEADRRRRRRTREIEHTLALVSCRGYCTQAKLERALALLGERGLSANDVRSRLAVPVVEGNPAPAFPPAHTPHRLGPYFEMAALEGSLTLDELRQLIGLGACWGLDTQATGRWVRARAAELGVPVGATERERATLGDDFVVPDAAPVQRQGWLAAGGALTALAGVAALWWLWPAPARLGPGLDPALSADGQIVAYLARYPLLCDRETGRRTPLKLDDTPRSCGNLSVSADGGTVAFDAHFGDQPSEVYLYVRQAEALTCLARDGHQPSLSADGGCVAYVDKLGQILVNEGGKVTRIGFGTAPALSADGRVLAFVTASGSLALHQRAGGNSTTFGEAVEGRPQLSGDGTQVAYSSGGQVWLWEAGAAKPLARGRHPSLSADGRRVAYESGEHLFLWEGGSSTALFPKLQALQPALAGDGRTLAFAVSEQAQLGAETDRQLYVETRPLP